MNLFQSLETALYTEEQRANQIATQDSEACGQKRAQHLADSLQAGGEDDSLLGQYQSRASGS